MASDKGREYKKKSHDIFLNIRKNLWMIQYSFTLAFVFAGYLNPIVDSMVTTEESRVKMLNDGIIIIT